MAITKVTTDVITDGAVTAPKLATDSVTADKLAANSVTAAKIAAGTLTDQVANNSITAAKIPNATALTLDGGVTIDNINIDGTTMALSSGDLTLDVAGNIVLDADGGGVYFKDAGTNIGFLQNDAGEFRIVAAVQDKDIVFMGEDGGSTITALTLDMSDAGAATFNSVVNIGTASGTQPSYFHSYLNVQNNASTSSNSSLTITAGSAGYAGLHFGDSDNGRIGQVAYNNSDNALLFTANNSERMRIDSSGNVLINNTSSIANPSLDDLQVGSGSGNTGMTIYSGTSNYGGLAFADGNTGASDQYPGLVEYFHTDNALQFYTNAALAMKITSAGQVLANSLGTTTPTFAFINDPNTGMSRPTTDALNFCTNGAERMRIDAAGALWLKGGTTTGVQDLAFQNSYHQLADNAALTISSARNTGCMIAVGSYLNGAAGITYNHGLFFGDYGSNNAMIKIADPSGTFGVASGTDNLINVVVSGNSDIVIENKSGAVNRLSVALFRFLGL